MPKSVVIDANVIVSSLFGGVPRKALLEAIEYCDVFISPQIEQEMISLLGPLKNKLKPNEIRRLKAAILNLLYLAKKIDATDSISLSRDGKDNKYLDLCLAANADFLITGDKDLLEIKTSNLGSVGLAKLKIVSPKDFLRLR